MPRIRCSTRAWIREGYPSMTSRFFGCVSMVFAAPSTADNVPGSPQPAKSVAGMTSAASNKTAWTLKAKLLILFP